MKRLILIAALAVTPLLRADEHPMSNYLELLRADFKTQKVAVVTEVMQLSSAEAEAFWPIYREYELELTKLGDAELALIKEYAAHYQEMTNEKADELVRRVFGLQKKQTRLKEKYYKRIKKATSATTAARWLQVENQIDALMDLQVGTNLPFVPRLPGAK